MRLAQYLKVGTDRRRELRTEDEKKEISSRKKRYRKRTALWGAEKAAKYSITKGMESEKNSRKRKQWL